MVAVDAAGVPVRISGAALAGGPLLAIAANRRGPDTPRVSGAGGSAFPAVFRRAAEAAVSALDTAGALATQAETLPARWGIPAYFGGAPFGPPYELENRAAEWLLSSDAADAFTPSNRQARMAQSVHPRGPALPSGGAFFAALYGTAPTPRSLGIGVDVIG